MMNNKYRHVLKSTSFRIGKSCHLSHCTAKAGSGFNFCLRALKLKVERGEEKEMAPNVSGNGDAEGNRVVIKEHFCRACEMVLHPECSTLWHILVFMGVDFFLPTPCWYCQDMVRDAWTAEFPADMPPGAKRRKMKKAKQDEAAAVEEEPAQREEDAAVEEEPPVPEEDATVGGESGGEEEN
mmetsp:Transcript_39671/g.65487  ORF Transcript_39671/g.65487 Transcript_39671/m.65487 type:complete len:182 (+) Transcript_39671:361-906(+)